MQDNFETIHGKTVIIKYPNGSASYALDTYLPDDVKDAINEYSEISILDTYAKITVYEKNPNI
jgi:hypothetical protein